MVFFRNKDDGQEQWKEKYFRLLEDQEKTEKQYKANEDLLCKTIVRFALAVKGLNRQLDPHLNRIRNLLKNGLQSQLLQKELTAFSSALIMLEDDGANHPLDSTLLFEFLGKLYPQWPDQFEDIQQRYQNRQFANNQALYMALLELVDQDKSANSIDLALDFAEIDKKAINLQLMRVLESIDIPTQFAEKSAQLKHRLNENQSLGPIFDDTVALLLTIKKYMEAEQLEMAAFLSKLTEQLTELGIKAIGVNLANESSAKKRNLLDRTVSDQLVDLQTQSANATQLEPLKQLINSRLQTISQQIQAHNQLEQQEREKVDRELRVLSEKLKDMEAESGELRERLDQAQHRATRDPLTGLANRLAFEERIDLEIARYRRTLQAFSLIVWDVDFFKAINDTYGHKSGDKALVAIAKLLSKHCRQSDFVARFGGEEFVMLLPDTDAQAALSVAEKLRAIVGNSGFVANGNRLAITISGGISQFAANDTQETIFDRADKGLYQAKQNGRNRCIVA